MTEVRIDADGYIVVRVKCRACRRIAVTVAPQRADHDRLLCMACGRPTMAVTHVYDDNERPVPRLALAVLPSKA